MLACLALALVIMSTSISEFCGTCTVSTSMPMSHGASTSLAINGKQLAKSYRETFARAYWLNAQHDGRSTSPQHCASALHALHTFPSSPPAIHIDDFSLGDGECACAGGLWCRQSPGNASPQQQHVPGVSCDRKFRARDVREDSLPAWIERRLWSEREREERAAASSECGAWHASLQRHGTRTGRYRRCVACHTQQDARLRASRC
jgi:hypothetical protein